MSLLWLVISQPKLSTSSFLLHLYAILYSLPLGERYQGKHSGSFCEKPALVLSSTGTEVLFRLAILLGIGIVDKYDFSEGQ